MMQKGALFCILFVGLLTLVDAADNIDDIAEYIRPNEGLETTAYEDSKGFTTVGVGFNMERAGAKDDWEKVLPDVDFDKVKNKELDLTEEQALKLFKADLKNIYIPRAKGIFPKFDEYCAELQSAIVDALYRGDLGPKTQSLIKEEKWKEAGKEYIDHGDYKKAVAGEAGFAGIKTRMDKNKKIFEEQACDAPKECEKDKDCDCCDDRPYCCEGICSECTKDEHCTKANRNKCVKGDAGAWVCGDPHVSVQLNDGLKTHFCFDVVGKSGEIFQFVRDRNIEIRVRIFGYGAKQVAKLVDLIAIRTNEAQITVDNKGITNGKSKFKWGSDNVGEFGDAKVMIRRNYAEIFVDKTVTEIEHQGDHLKFSVHQHGGLGPHVCGILGDVVNQGRFKKEEDEKHGHIELFDSTFSVTEKEKNVGKCWFLTNGYNSLKGKLRNYVKKTLFGSS